MKRWLKAALGWLAFHSGAYRRYFRGRAIIVLFHRVDDRYPGNPISCTEREFAAFLSFFTKFFTVIPLSELLDRVASGDTLDGRLVITFDDGYRDNHATAAPELARRRLPATFYIATDFIASAHVPWWDVDAGIASEWMSWDDVRSLASRGFSIGAHTMHHVDLGVVEGAEAEREIVGSRERLERELGTAIPDFTYPYGRINQFTDANRDLVRAAGFRSCLSAYGGDVRSGDNVHSLKRTPISPWFVSPYQFGFEVMRGALTPASVPSPRTAA